MFSDLDRPPLAGLRAPAFRASAGWRVTVVTRTGSTNADVVELARRGERPGYVLVAEEQTGGRGRLGRRWVSPPRAGLTFSALLSPPPSPWVPLLAGVAVAAALRDVCEVEAVLKWPNDVLIGGSKVCGILAEVAASPGAPARVVLGVGLNVTTTAEELPADRPATSLRLAGARVTDRATILRAILAELAAERAPADYRSWCATLGETVTIGLPDGTQVSGLADDVDPDGRIVIDGVPYAVGDVVHLR
jgi:BirA family transcriptional regulator, biotin operon repressor / biotin---[acetyl-CoA-carboxylase] ligase